MLLTDEAKESSPMNVFENVLWRADVAALWSWIAGKPVSKRTVSSYLDKSKPADPATGRPAGRYADDPMPQPAYRGRYPYWTTDQIPALAEWWRDRPGPWGNNLRSTSPPKPLDLDGWWRRRREERLRESST